MHSAEGTENIFDVVISASAQLAFLCAGYLVSFSIDSSAAIDPYR
jgi:hypothetical protein